MSIREYQAPYRTGLFYLVFWGIEFPRDFPQLQKETDSHGRPYVVTIGRKDSLRMTEGRQNDGSTPFDELRGRMTGRKQAGEIAAPSDSAGSSEWLAMTVGIKREEVASSK
jgi:hypothetical protein